MQRVKLAIMASGEGTNFEAIVQAASTGDLQAEIVGLLTNKEKCGAIERAKKFNVPSKPILRASFPSLQAWDAALCDQLKKWNAEWVALAGFTGLIGPAVLENFPNRVVNSHPSLLPKFGGKGMYGNNVHAAVLAAQEVETGITIHLLNERFDEGPTVAQLRVPVNAGDTTAQLAERVKTAERQFYPRVLQDLLTGRIKSR